MNEASETDPMDETTGSIPWTDAETIERVVADTWSTYLGVTPSPADNRTTPATATAGGHIEARIRIRGEVVWEMTLCGSLGSAEDATRRMLGSGDRSRGDTVPEVVPEVVLDAWGELVNTLAGNLKASLPGGTYTLSIPQASVDQTSPTTTQDISEHRFAWDGHLAVIRIGRVTSA